MRAGVNQVHPCPLVNIAELRLAERTLKNSPVLYKPPKEETQMSKLLATLVAALFATATITPVIAQDKKDAAKAEAKKEDSKKDASKTDAKKEDSKKAEGKKS